MKKKLILTVSLIAVLACAFAFCVSAVTGSSSNEYGTVTEVTGMDTLANTYSDHTSRVVLKNADGTFTTYPSYYIYNGKTSNNMRIDMTTLNTALGLSDEEKYTSASVIRVEVFANARLDYLYAGCTSLIDVYLPEGVWLHYASFSGCTSLTTITLPQSCTSIPTSCFYGCTSLETVAFPSTLTSLGSKAFQNCTSLKRADLPSGVTSIPQDCFHACTSLEYLKVPSSCTTIANYVTNGCSKVLWDLSEATSLQSIGSNNSYGVTTSLVFPDGFKTISGVSSSAITELVFPNSTTSIGVIKCSSLQEFVIPAGVTSLGSKAFDYSTALKKVTIPMGVTSISASGDTSFFHTTPTTIVFTGSADAAVLESIKTVLPNATIEFANHCEVYYKGEHIESDPVVNFVGEEFLSTAQVCDECTRCTMTVVLQEVAPLFVNKGWSYSESDAQLSQTFKIDDTNLAFYKESFGIVSFGLVGAIHTYYDENNEEQVYTSDSALISVVDGKIVTTGAVSASFEGSSYSIFSMKMTGLTGNNQKARIYLNAYVATSDTVYYLSDGVASQGSATDSTSIYALKQKELESTEVTE